MVYIIQSHLLIWKTYADAFETSREGFLLAQDISSYSLTIVAHEAKKLMPEGGSIVATTYLGAHSQFKIIM